MAFVTYILLAALQSGLQSRFDPEILGLTATTALFIVFADFLVLKVGCYILGIQSSSPVVDLMAYCGYKFVGCVEYALSITNEPLTKGAHIFSVILTLTAGLLKAGRTVWMLVFLYAFLANAFFLVRPSLLLSFFLYSLYSLLLRGPAFLTQQLRSLRSVVLPDVSGAPAAVGTVSHAQRSRRITFLFVVAVTQVLYMGVLVRV